MPVTVVPGSVKINVTQRPKVNKPTVPFSPPFGGDPPPVFAGFTCEGISLVGELKLNGAPTDIEACTLGFIQMQWVETYWLHYRGKTNKDGSMLIQVARPPARPQQICRDCSKESISKIWVNENDNGTPTDVRSSPLTVFAVLDDTPFEAALLGQVNSLTGQTNLLSEAQIERHFCSILSLQDDTGRFRHQASRYWNVHWQARFKPGDFDDPFKTSWTVTPVAGGNSAAVGATIFGAPSDKRFAGAILAPGVPICNDLIKQADDVIDNLTPFGKINPAFNPRTRRESPVWTNFDVRR
jgi:hypothetical protein